MHPAMMSGLAAEHRRTLIARADRRRALPAAARRGPRPAPGALTRPWPRLCVTWSRITLAAATSQGRGRSWVIVISATRAL